MRENILRNIIEVVTLEELDNLLESSKSIRAYMGFEPSGLVHIGTGLLWPLKLKDLESFGIKNIVLLADWHAMINDKLNGNMDHIRLCGEYMIECFRAVGLNAEYVFASELVRKSEYWEKVIRIAKNTTLKRAKRAMTIMGRKEDDAEIDSSKILYPFMQVADIFELDVDIALGGMDQRHAHMLARDVAEKLKLKKIVALHGPLITSLQGGSRMDFIDSKMSKSKPKSTLYVHDSDEVIRKKIMEAYCPEKTIEGNPILEILKYIVFPYFTTKFKIERSEKHGGDIVFERYEDLENAYRDGNVHPLDLKNATAKYLIEILQPIREKIEKSGLLEDMLDIVGLKNGK